MMLEIRGELFDMDLRELETRSKEGYTARN